MDKAHRATDKILDSIERRLFQIYRRANGEISLAWGEYMEKAEKETAKLQAEYDEAVKSGDKKAIKKKKRALEAKKREITLKDDRFAAVVDTTSERLADTNAAALAYINGKLPKVYVTNYNFVGQQIENAVEGYSFALVNERVVRDLALPYKQLDRLKDVEWNTKNIRREVLQGILLGEPVSEIGGRLQDVIGYNRKTAIYHARTMVTSAENQGRQEEFEAAEEMGIVLEKRWIAVRDERTRQWHTDLNGKTVPIDEPFENDFGKIMYPGDPTADPANVYNCRCSMAAVIKGFREPKGGRS